MAGRVPKEKAQEWLRAVRPNRSGHRARGHRFSPEGSALLVVDMQRYFLEKGSHAHLPAAESIVGNIRDLLEAFRRKQLPVIFTRHGKQAGVPNGPMDRWWGDVLHQDDALADIVTQLEPKAGDAVVRKSQYSAFVGTDLEERMKALKVQRIVVSGVMTHLCCETTARDAFMRGFDVFIVVDGTASKSEELHVASLRTLTDGFAMPVTTEEVLHWLR